VQEVLALVVLEEQNDKTVGEFSKGMKNRLNFARSLLHRPKLWFLDEPTAGLDRIQCARKISCLFIHLDLTGLLSGRHGNYHQID
jgi:fluoroquinolone transport system ATP-binding protein